MSKTPTPKTFPSQLKGRSIIHVFSPTARTIKYKTKNLQAAVEEHGIVDIPSEHMPWLKKTIRSNVEDIRSGSKSYKLDLK
jgi:hypothetical protein